MKTLIVHGRRFQGQAVSPRVGREHCDLWGVTRANAPGKHFWDGTLRDWTAWFDMHPLSHRAPDAKFPGIPTRRPEAWRWYLEQDGTRPIYLQRPINDIEQRLFDQVPGATVFPLPDIQRAFPIAPGVPTTWFECQIGMMLAFGCFLGYERIILNGVGQYLSLTQERLHRDTLGWMFFARGRGIQVDVEGPSTYHAPKQIYAYEKLNYDLLDEGRLEEQRLEQVDVGIVQRQAADRARGRPIRIK